MLSVAVAEHPEAAVAVTVYTVLVFNKFRSGFADVAFDKFKDGDQT